ncbi:MAG: hypothetical protein AB1793_02820 [Candidatus Thermoplasmatota archaeon]
MRRLGIALMAVGGIFLLSGIAATAWAASHANAMSEEERAADPELYDFYTSAQGCSLGSAVIGMIIVAMGIIVGRRAGAAVEENQAGNRTGGV